MGSTSLSLVFCVAVLAAFGLVVTRVYKAFTSPLSKLPGPAYTKWTRLRLKYEILRSNRVYYIHDLHQEYGSIVRISPDEVSLADIQAAKTIYRVGGPYLKTSWYKNFTGNVAHESLFTLRDKDLHNHNRKLQSHHFSERWIATMEPFIKVNVQRAVGRMREDVDRKGHTDVLQWMTFMATDVIGEASFGESFCMLETGKKNQYSKDLELMASRGLIRTELPGLIKLLSYIPYGPSQQIGGASQRMYTYATESLARYERSQNADPENVKPTLITKLYDAVDTESYSQEQLVIDARGHIIAGTDTTAVTGTYAIWLLANRPEVEYDLIRAVSALSPDYVDEDLRKVKLLDNVIQETLRLHCAVGATLPREVPPGGAEFCGHYVPSGMTVGLQAWTMHRKPEIWDNPEVFDPSRWEQPSKDMKDAFLPFGGGSRVCIGMHLAQLELRHSLASFYREFTSGVKPATAEGFSEAEMKPSSEFLMPPRGHRCLVEPRKTAL